MNYLLTGEESYNLRSRRDEIIKNTVGDEKMAVCFYRGSDVSVDDVVEDCMMFPFFSDNKVVVFENPAFIKDKKKADDTEESEEDSVKGDNDLSRLIDYLANPAETTVLVIIVEKKLGAATLKKLTKYLKVETFNELTDVEFRNQVNSDLNQYKVDIEYKARTELLNRLPVSIENWKHELEKLILYPDRITVDVIKSLVNRQLEDDVFALTNAIARRDMATALRVYKDQLAINKYVVLSLVGLVASQLRFNSQIKMLLEKNYSYNQINELLQINLNDYGKANYRIEKALEGCQGLSSKDILKMLSDLSDLDQDIKTGKVEADTGFELYIIKTIKR